MTDSIEPLLSIEPPHTNIPTALIPNDSLDSIEHLFSTEPLHTNRSTVLILYQAIITPTSAYRVFNRFQLLSLIKCGCI